TVRIRFDGILQAYKGEQLVGALKLQVARDAALRPRSGDDRFCVVQRAFVDAFNHRNFKVKDSEFLTDLDGWKTAYAHIGAVQSGNKLFLVVVRNVELKTQAQAIGFQRRLPNTFGTGDGVTWLPASRASSLTMEGERKTDVALRPNPLNT